MQRWNGGLAGHFSRPRATSGILNLGFPSGYELNRDHRLVPWPPPTPPDLRVSAGLILPVTYVGRQWRDGVHVPARPPASPGDECVLLHSRGATCWSDNARCASLRRPHAPAPERPSLRNLAVSSTLSLNRVVVQRRSCSPRRRGSWLRKPGVPQSRIEAMMLIGAVTGFAFNHEPIPAPILGDMSPGRRRRGGRSRAASSMLFRGFWCRSAPSCGDRPCAGDLCIGLSSLIGSTIGHDRRRSIPSFPIRLAGDPRGVSCSATSARLFRASRGLRLRCCLTPHPRRADHFCARGSARTTFFLRHSNRPSRVAITRYRSDRVRCALAESGGLISFPRWSSRTRCGRADTAGAADRAGSGGVPPAGGPGSPAAGGGFTCRRAERSSFTPRPPASPSCRRNSGRRCPIRSRRPRWLSLSYRLARSPERSPGLLVPPVPPKRLSTRNSTGRRRAMITRETS